MKVLLMLLHVALVAASEIILPSTLKVCHLNDPQRDQCIKKLIQDVMRTLLSESPSDNLDLPIFDPLTMDFYSFKFGNDVIGYECVSNVTCSRLLGLRRLKIRNLQSEFKKNRVTVKAEVFIAKLFNTGNYNFLLRATHFPFRVASRGSLNFTASDTIAKWLIKGKLENVDGEDYLKIYRFDIDPDSNHFEMYFSDELISKVGENFINSYWRIIYKDVFQSMKPLFLKLTNQIFEKIPFRHFVTQD